MSAESFRPRTRFHGRIERDAPCSQAGCREPGEFRAPLAPGNFDGPGAWRWLCLDHVREFNMKYNYFTGMSPDEIQEQQRPMAGWERETRAFSTAGADRPLGLSVSGLSSPSRRAVSSEDRPSYPSDEGRK